MTAQTLSRNTLLMPRLRPLPVLVMTAATLLLLGVVMTGSASLEIASEATGNPFYFLIRQGIYAVLGAAVAIVVANVPMAWWEGSGWLLLGAGLAMLALVLTPLGTTVNGSTRWISLGLFNVQVSEVAKICLIAYLAGYVVRRREELVDTWMGFLKPVFVLTLASGLLMAEPDFGATAVLMAATMGMIFLSGVRLTRFLPLIGISVAIGSALVMTQPYRLKRVVSYLDPWKDQFDTGYQLTQSLIAFGRGEWMGVGLGNSIQKLFYLPEAHTDFVFAIIAEEFGLLGSSVVLVLFGLLVWSALIIARRAEVSGMPFAACFGYGLTLLIGLQALINMGVSTGLLPTKGLTLPLVSYGGSSLLATCVCIGVLARIELERQDREQPDNTGKAPGGGARYDD